MTDKTKQLCEMCAKWTDEDLLISIDGQNEKLVVIVGQMYLNNMLLENGKRIHEQLPESMNICAAHTAEALRKMYDLLEIKKPNDFSTCSQDTLENIMISYWLIQKDFPQDQFRTILQKFMEKYDPKMEILKSMPEREERGRKRKYDRKRETNTEKRSQKAPYASRNKRRSAPIQPRQPTNIKEKPNLDQKIRRLESTIYENTLGNWKDLFEAAKNIALEAYKCPICPVEFMTKAECLSHYNLDHQKHQEFRWFCEECFRPFENERFYHQHMANHESVKKYKIDPHIMIPTPEKLKIILSGIIQFLTQEDMETEMKSITSKVEGVLEVSPGVCRILLQKYNWNKETLINQFHESTDATAFLTNANVLAKRSQEAVTGGESECEICCDVGELSSLECNHMACRECWKAYLTEKIRDGQCEIECLAADCKLLIDEEKIVSYITDPSVVTLYRRAIVNHYVDVNTMLKWCPGVDCGKAVRVTHTDSQLITCSCGCRFCFACCEDFHEPITCRQLKLWQKRCRDDSETFNLISAN